ncbi:MAG: hypothetical protein JST88_00735 [Bacteroidetes bacterium]|nr:hypothetical protein [Bacteroidota bacterium]
MSTSDFIKIRNKTPVIFQISSQLNVGSVGRIAEQIGEKIIEQGWESYIVYGRKALGSQSKNFQREKPPDEKWQCPIEQNPTQSTFFKPVKTPFENAIIVSTFATSKMSSFFTHSCHSLNGIDCGEAV